jgi:outer membrane receptor protein involved in Fe transport
MVVATMMLIEKGVAWIPVYCGIIRRSSRFVRKRYSRRVTKMAHPFDPLNSVPRKSLSAAISALCAGVPLAQAQAQDAADETLGLEEVIVTGTKRGALNLQDVPLSITALTSETIRTQGFKQLDDYFGQIPSLTFGRTEPGGSNVIMRGCAISGFSFGDSPTTGVYLDEQPITAASPTNR